MPVKPTQGLGLLVAHALEGSWRPMPQPLTLPPNALQPLVEPAVACGVAPLVFRRLEQSVRSDPVCERLKATAQQATASFERAQTDLRTVLDLLDAAGIRPMLFKGLAVGQIYGDPSVRPGGDLDLVVGPDALAATRSVLAAAARPRKPGHDMAPFVIDSGPESAAIVDLHAGFPACYATDVKAALSRAVSVRIGEAYVLIPAPEDHLRLVMLHFLRHGGWRPLWLCDVAALIEAAPPDFDIDLLLTDDPITRDWLMAVAGAARDLLGCRLDRLPTLMTARTPQWLLYAILREWETPLSLWQKLAGSSGWKRVRIRISDKWPNPIRAAFLRRRPVEAPALVLSRLSQCAFDELPTAVQTLARRVGRQVFCRLGAV